MGLLFWAMIVDDVVSIRNWIDTLWRFSDADGIGTVLEGATTLACLWIANIVIFFEKPTFKIKINSMDNFDYSLIY